ncbi:MAG: helix-turn-helix transcriptional regulator [Deltaproteobacteria bacterium]|nr:helix-turn-helix transcriptional regulator [Deltaproteobacteria bacterium]MBW2596382.1 helix-turn-helix transcriptional regulator [Deltaproteobacteria bacterium]MBW2649772.1 helix-turn-helix transcriptional regulator [Deltaproteobacteria bacterium]
MKNSKENVSDLQNLNLGQKIRALRLRRKFTLQVLSKKTGISVPFLSQIENDGAFPPVSTLLKISKALEVNIVYFFGGEPISQRIALVRKDERWKTSSRQSQGKADVNYRYETLSHSISGKSMEPFLVEFSHKAEEDLIFFTHSGEEFIFIMEGELEVRFRGFESKQIFVMNPGDSLYFYSDIPHAIRAISEKNVTALVVVHDLEQNT